MKRYKSNNLWIWRKSRFSKRPFVPYVNSKNILHKQLTFNLSTSLITLNIKLTTVNNKPVVPFWSWLLYLSSQSNSYLLTYTTLSFYTWRYYDQASILLLHLNYSFIAAFITNLIRGKHYDHTSTVIQSSRKPFWTTTWYIRRNQLL